MENNTTSIRKLRGTRVKKGNRLPRNFGRIDTAVFFPNEKRVAGFVTTRSTFLILFRRKSHFISINGYYVSDDKVFIRPKKGALDYAAYKALGLYPEEFVYWIDLPVITEDGQDVGIISDVTFVHETGEVTSIEVSPGAMSKFLKTARTIPADMIRIYGEDASDASSLVAGKEDSAGEGTVEYPPYAIIVPNEALDIETKNAVASKASETVSQLASDAGVDTAAVSEKAKSAAEVAGALATAGAVATGKQLKKTKGMFSAFKEEYNKARHGEPEDED